MRRQWRRRILSKAVSCWAAVVRKYRSRQRRLERSASHGRARVAAACFIAWAAAAAAAHRSPHSPPASLPPAAPVAALAEAEAIAAEVQQRCACAMMVYAWRQHTRCMSHVTSLLAHLATRVRRRVTTQTLRAWHVYTRQLPRCSPSPPVAFTFDTPAAATPPTPVSSAAAAAAAAAVTTTPSAVPFRPAARPRMPHTPGADWQYADTEPVVEPATHVLRAEGGGDTATAAAAAGVSVRGGDEAGGAPSGGAAVVVDGRPLHQQTRGSSRCWGVQGLGGCSGEVIVRATRVRVGGPLQCGSAQAD